MSCKADTALITVGMNCEPGDIAIVIEGDYVGWVFHIVKSAPTGAKAKTLEGEDFEISPDHWIVESLSGHFPPGDTSPIKFVTAADRALMPIGRQDVKAKKNREAVPA